MSGRDLVVLGTASQVPTRERAHHAALLRFDGLGILLDPGEGTQRQLTHARLPASRIDRVCITHAHGDHCLGLAGIVQRRSLDGVTTPVEVHHPAHATPYVRRLIHASYTAVDPPVRLQVATPGRIVDGPPLEIHAAALDHSIPTLGYRFQQPPGRQLDPARLEQLGVPPPARSELIDHGHLTISGRRVDLEEVSHTRPPVSVAHVMDTRWCDGALELAEGADLLLIEATFLEADRATAERAGHLTARQAAELARNAGARRTVLTHLSRRYPGRQGHLEEARAAAPGLDLRVAADLEVIPLPVRQD